MTIEQIQQQLDTIEHLIYSSREDNEYTQEANHHLVRAYEAYAKRLRQEQRKQELI